MNTTTTKPTETPTKRYELRWFGTGPRLVASWLTDEEAEACNTRNARVGLQLRWVTR